MPAIFGDHMVLQQGIFLPIWGEADPKEQISIHFAGQSVTTKADTRGVWRVNLKPVSCRKTSGILKVEGRNSLTFSDVLVGDVWLCGGGSNMALPLIDSYRGQTFMEQANEPELRLFVVNPRRTLRLQKKITGEWRRCTPEAAAHFSAVGYFFGTDVHKITQLPIGLIGCYEEEAPLQAWISFKALQEAPSFSHYLAEYHALVRDFSQATATYSQRQATSQSALIRWRQEVEKPYQQELASWRVACDDARFKLQAQPVRPQLAEAMPEAPQPPDGGNQLPSGLFNGMLAPLIPYAIAGVIWYQGESNEGAASFEYRRLFLRLIRSWRTAWGEGPFPFFFVSLAAHGKPSSKTLDLMRDEEGRFNSSWPWVREGQAAALTLPETGMVVASDLGDPYDITPLYKLDVGRRLGLLARKNVYGEQVIDSGPIYRSMKKEGSKIRIFFDDIGSGLTLGAPAWSYDDKIPLTCSLKGFAIAGSDRHWQEATAHIDGNSVVVSSDYTECPDVVRYNWKNNPSGNLYNKEGLPAAPFRTDLDQP